MNAPETMKPATQPISLAHKVLLKSDDALCAEEIACAILGVDKPSKIDIKSVTKQLKQLADLGMIEMEPRAGGVPFYRLIAAPPSVVTHNPHTGTPRNPLDIESDPAGLLIVKDGEPLKAHQAEDRILTPEAEAEREDFEARYGMLGNCSCHISPPCGSCTHPGNPRNQEEDETAWMAAGDSEGGETDAPAANAQRDEFTLLGLIADIRAAAGDPTGRLMQDELVRHIAAVVKERDDLRERLDAQITQWQTDTGRLEADLRAAMEARSQAINEADRLRADLAAERQAREELQEQADVVDAEFVAPPLNAKGYVLKAPKRPLRRFEKEASAKSAAMAAARRAGRVEVFALVPVGTARRGAEWRSA